MNHWNLQLESPSNSIEDLEGFIREERIRGLKINLLHKQPEDGKMGLDPDTIELIAVVAGSGGAGVAFIKGIFDCIKDYIKLNHDDKVTLKDKDKEITFDKDSVKDLQKIIENFIAVENDIEGKKEEAKEEK